MEMIDRDQPTFFAVVGFSAVEVALGLADADLTVVDLVVGLAVGLATVAVLVVAAFFTVFTGLFYNRRG